LDCVHRLPYQVCLKTIYACGLRLLEGTRLRVKDIDSQRKMIHVVQGKGNKDRYVPLPDHTLKLLRHFWVTHRNPDWMFPVRNGLEPMNETALQKANNGPLKFENTNKFEAKDGGTLLVQTFQGEVGGFFKMAEGLAIKQMQKQVESDGDRLKKLLEAM
jgi:hypothetical protein